MKIFQNKVKTNKGATLIKSQPKTFGKVIRDNLAISISVIGLGISFLTFYYNHLLVDEDLLVKAINLDVLNHKDSSAVTDSLILTVMYNNRGNRQATITAPHFFFANLNQVGLVGANIIYPLRLEPKEVKFFRIMVPFPVLKGQKKSYISPMRKDSLYHLKLGIVYHANGSDGKERSQYEYLEIYCTDYKFSGIDSGLSNSFSDAPFQLL